MSMCYEFICRDCKKSYFIGCISGKRCMVILDKISVAEWDNLPDHGRDEVPPTSYRSFTTNMNFRQCLAEHETHNWTVILPENYSTNKNGDLEDDWSMRVFIEGYASYEEIDLTERKDA